jgi:hypothetical protein
MFARCYEVEGFLLAVTHTRKCAGEDVFNSCDNVVVRHWLVCGMVIQAWTRVDGSDWEAFQKALRLSVCIRDWRRVQEIEGEQCAMLRERESIYELVN